MSDTLVIQVNGETRETTPGTTIASLLNQLGLNQGRVAIELNLHVLPKSRWGDTPVAHGDHLEIVQLVGGG
jgi:thiamine biosynthesis protein ThiS